jgi:DNA-binding winged helix-turn-helix (wHTH) protein/TolB-like protein/Tfp pilus assembly protein PilF
MSPETQELYEFGRFHLDPYQRLLLRDGQSVPVTHKAFELLIVLIEHSGCLVEKDELLNRVWQDVAVEEGNLAVVISHLRKALGDDREKHEYIETVPKHGYRFVPPVKKTEIRRQASGSVPALSHPGADAANKGSRTRLVVRRTAIAALAAPGAFALVLAWGTTPIRSAPVSSPSAIHSLAVLPFQGIGDTSGTEYLGEGAADALTTRLGKISSIIVRSTSSTDQYRNGSLNPAAIGRAQGVDAVLDGRIQRDGDRIRLTVQLVRVSDGAELWADSFDEKWTNIFAVEDQISDRVAASLQVRLTGAETMRINRKPTENTLAYDSYLKGRYFWNKRTGESLRLGLSYFREAIRLDPNFAAAYEGVADSYATLGLYAIMPPDEAFPAATAAAKKALSMDDTLAEAHATLGLIHFYYDWDGLAAENEFRRAIEINPNYAMAHSWNGEALAAMGQFSQAVVETQLAMNDDPLSLIVNSNAGWTIFLSGQTNTAVQILQKAIELDPTFPRTHFRLGIIYQSQGLHRRAIAEFRKAEQLSDENPYYEASLAAAYADSGDPGTARQLLARLHSRSKDEYVPAYGFALVYAGLDDRSTAFEWLRRAGSDHSTSMAFARLDPALANLRSYRQFSDATSNLRF